MELALASIASNEQISLAPPTSRHRRPSMNLPGQPQSALGSTRVL
jgi:hypothetical protein